jgi:phosphotransferase system enzyme I (PtsI)
VSTAPPGGSSTGKIVVRGVPVAPGLAVGAALFHDESDVDVPVRSLRADEVPGELKRLTNALRAAKRQLQVVEQSIGKEVGRRDARIFSVQQLLLEDPAFRKDLRATIEQRLVNAEVAVRDAVGTWSARLAGVPGGDPVADLRDVGRRLLRQLAGRAPSTTHAEVDEDGDKLVLVTKELLPSDTAQLDRSHLAAIVTASGGTASHAAILARAMGIPAVTDVDVSSLPATGGAWIVDGTKGEVVLNPSDEDLASARVASAEFARLRDELLAHTRGVARTSDDVAVELMANVENFTGLPDELVEDLMGVGLYRTEFLFMASSSFPTEEQQFTHYKSACERLGDREITFRTIDVGGDKPLPYFGMPHEPNPVLGWRGLRLSLEWPDMFYTQVRALLRASAHGNLRILVPMVTMVEEFRRARAIVEDVQEDLRRDGVPFAEDVKLGAMVEVPAAALASRALAEEADFLSVGTNDLSQYALAVDRNNARVAELYQPLHPGVISLVRQVIRSGEATDTPVSVCGEMAGEPDAALLLLGCGLRSFSVSPYRLPVIRRLFANVRTEDARAVAEEALGLRTIAEIHALLHRHVLAVAPELATLLPVQTS